MRLPRFLLGMLAALLVFAVVTYILTGSFWSTLWQTVLCGLLIQFGYFLAIVFLVSRTPEADDSARKTDGTATGERRGRTGSTIGKIGVLQSLRRLGTLK